MTGRRADKQARREETTGAGRRPGEKTPAAADTVIPVCLGEFGIGEAGGLCPLWEATWSQDARSRTKKK